MIDERREDAVFGVVVSGVLMYQTLSPNPSRALRVYKKLTHGGSGNVQLMQFRMRRTRLPGDVRGVFKEAMLNKEPYVGPMR